MNQQNLIIQSPKNYIGLHIWQFKTPLEKINKNFKKIQQLIYKFRKSNGKLLSSLESATSKSSQLSIVDKLINQQETFNKRLNSRLKNHNGYIDRLRKRISRLVIYDDLFKKYHNLNDKQIQKMNGLPTDLDKFYQEENNILIIDHLLKFSNHPIINENENPGIILAKKLGLEDLIDIDTILQGLKIHHEIKSNQNYELLSEWCIENEKFLNAQINNGNNLNESMGKDNEITDNEKIDNDDFFEFFAEEIDSDDEYQQGDFGLAFEAKIQRSIELIKNDQFLNACDILKDEFNNALNLNKIPSVLSKIPSLAWYNLAIGDLNENVYCNPFAAYSKNEQFKFNNNFSERLDDSNSWSKIADLFLKDFNKLYGMPLQTPLTTMLNMGLSSIKVGSCNLALSPASTTAPTTATTKRPSLKILTNGKNHDKSRFISNNSECSVCSPILTNIAKSLPFSSQSKANVYNDAVKLPNNNIYSFGKLLELSNYAKQLSDSKMSAAFKELEKSICYGMTMRDLAIDQFESFSKEQQLDFSNDLDMSKESLEPLWRLNVQFDQAQKIIPLFLISDPITLETFKIEELKRVYIT